jgi:DNA-binding LytR/AlgR family response regulator
MHQASVLGPITDKNKSPLLVVSKEQPVREIAPMDSIFIRTDRKYVRLLFADIVYIEALRNYVRVVTSSQQYLVLMKIGNMESLLPAGQFSRIHRSYIISLHRVKTFDNESVEVEEKKLPVGKTYKNVLRNSFDIAG